ncbi:short chain enoyl-CoA hydratase /3-hydroxyacyl-CoA dehydrogenase [Pseudomonas reinekei]|jgi:3-hydroxyacyl-CoA dehydrogenase|uniref:3-hydroxybutyryl-CoA epimerase n=1 Tax=Pseudomonas reinekei TaxID=395598 RepID=A0A1H0UJZ0_PSERE|nr:3-hydroxyacyl-CoA dehydrogenase NAD-binding domain-containing protein [Pseudomonas reinekei]KAB0488308.1 3-hydroxybutyryl-CoA epimerase [Pseudomonas reinekei]OLU05797.1 3-hydroxybutyryl-CoA epimerase [Pseudomonas reinekei]SDP66390.1 short chain enoyl-CoA hydratase /3-hydroxyacyl-CoA dehydrogenase [Pseudomonas reinekei]
MDALVSLKTDDGIAVIAINNPPVNALSQGVRQQLSACLALAGSDPAVQAIVITCQGKTFVAGADLKEFDQPLMEPHLPDVLSVIENSQKPVIAALHGSVLGGGFELALACHLRIADEHTVLGLPEVSLGLIPGAGGTQRLVRLCGPLVAVDVVIGGQRLSATQAQAVGLVDHCVADDLPGAAIEHARRFILTHPFWERTRDRLMPAHNSAEFETKVTAVMKKLAGQEAPQAALKAINAALTESFDAGMALERSLFIERRQSAQAKALRHLFFAERALAGRTRTLAANGQGRGIEKVAVIGSGTMGSGIAICVANAGVAVSLIDVQDAALQRGVKHIDDYYRDALLKGRMDEQVCQERRALISPSTSMDAVADADLVIEAVFEDMEVKREVFRQLDTLCKPDAILATNTSYLDVEAIADCTRRPQQVLGMHFFSPAPVMKLLEVVRTTQTDRSVLAAVLGLALRLGKVAVTVGVCDGFVGNRLLAAREREAMFLLEEGASPEAVDRVMRAFGFPIGPFELRDMAGVDVAWRNRQGRLSQLSEREKRCDWVDTLYAAGRLGQKAGLGFYRYASGSRQALPDPWLAELLADHRQQWSITPRSITDHEIEERCLFAMVNEAAWLIEHDIVAHPADIDLVWIHGYGFPRYKAGLTYYADQVGLGVVAKALKRYNREGRELSTFMARQKKFHCN